MPQQTPSYSKRLPLVVVLLCYISLAVIVTLSYFNMRSVDRGRGVRIHGKGFSYDIPHNRFLAMSIEGTGAFASGTIQAINVPGMFGEVIASIVARTWPDSWRPHLFGTDPPGLFVWRGWIFPLYCIPFWWFSGLGIDALRGTRRLHWAVYLLGSLLAGFFAVLFIGMTVMVATEKDRDLTFAIVGLLLWTLLLTAFPIAWVRMIRRNRAHARTLPTAGA